MNKTACMIAGKSTTVVMSEEHVSFSTHHRFSAFPYTSDDVEKAIIHLAANHQDHIVSSQMDNGLIQILKEEFGKLHGLVSDLNLVQLHMDNGVTISQFYHRDFDDAVTAEEIRYGRDDKGGLVEHKLPVIIADTTRREWWVSHKEIGEVIETINKFVVFEPWKSHDLLLSLMTAQKQSRERKRDLPNF
ncbi:hypothetical protein Erwinia_phage_Tian_00118 [Erwinia phage Tian]|uniref:Uncharacterized protein n=7 Tax=Caudoviricetes TaxID=2731619 RepID=A0A6B9RHC3_9CAUD|nr:hypothetical protein Ea21-4_gp11 [Erwinia phage phiEa21-4]AXN57333.1 hypothetical protein SUNLIREN_11 [Erwinia phage SunLIRen]AYD79511.1 hypothetical protein LINGLNFE_00003 [Enterobacter phage phi63_307]QEG07665.1 hypothetical protein [Salmonella phage SE5]QGF21862.1 hypothetical protein [Salmonella phage ST-3]QHI00556.1 hypothetical protein [Salmonella phage vB_SenM_SB18]UFD98343.1 hypothetical protein SPARTY_20 [Hafnia phage vB_HalM_SPARTY]WJN64437.1 hypothetical protein Erwinia_phage_P